jgi:hypothetical protein
MNQYDDYLPSEAYDSDMPPQYDLYVEERQLMSKLDRLIEEYGRCGVEHAKRDREYYALKAAKTLELKEQGMPATVIAQIIKGVDPVAGAREKMLVSETMARATLEAILSTKLQIKIVESQLQREYSNPQAGY